MAQRGDFAPELTFTSVVRSPNEMSWSHDNFVGRLTIVIFFSNLLDTTEAFAARWNELGFKGKPMTVSVFEDSAPGTKVD